MEDITDADYIHEKKEWKNFRIKNLGEYYDFVVWSDTSLLVNVVENVRNECIEKGEHVPAHFYQQLD